MKHENAKIALDLADSLSYKGKDLIIMAAQTVIGHALADAVSPRGFAPNSYGTFVVDAGKALDQGRLCGYVRWPLDDGEVEDASWALCASGERVIVSRVDTMKRVTIPCNRLFKR